MKEKFIRFMQGRYGSRGTDDFSKFLLGLCFVFILLNLIFRNSIWNTLALLILFYCYFRLFSKNFSKRYEENQRYLVLKNKVTYKFSRQKSELAQRKTHHIYKCPSCKQKIRVPKGKGNIIVTCPKCKTEFQKRS